MKRNEKFKEQCLTCVYQLNKGSRCLPIGLTACFDCRNKDWRNRCNCEEEAEEKETICFFYKEEGSANERDCPWYTTTT